MPGRTLGSGTKEGFTGKEQDAETGLDYFGARYYMAALGRWASVDPLADGDPEWSPYNYVHNNPLGFMDPTGLTCVTVHDEKQCDDIKPEDINDISAFLGQDLGQFNDGGQSDQKTAEGPKPTSKHNAGMCESGPDCWFQGLANWGARKGGLAGDIALNVGAGLNAASEAFGTNDLGAAIGKGDIGGAAFALATMLPVGKLGKIGRVARELPFAGELAQRVGRALDEIAAGVRRFAKDGTEFKNIEGLLPKKPAGYYHEFTVPTASGERGAQRIVKGAGGETFFSPDHYRSFVRIQP